MNLFKTTTKSSSKYVAFFDIGSGSVGSALVRFEKNQIPNIIWSKRIPIGLKESVSFDRLTKSMFSTVLDMALMLQTEAIPIMKRAVEKKKKLDDVVFVLASPWYLMRSKVFKVEKRKEEKSITLTEQFIKNLLQKEEERFKKSISDELSPLKKSEKDDDPMLIEQHIVQTTLNGYQVTNPYKKEIKNAQIDLVLSAMSRSIYEKVKEIANQLLSRDGGTFKSFIIISFLMSRDLFHDSSNFLLVNISSEMTDITTVQKGTLVGTTSFSLGRHFIIREIAKHLNTIPEEAESLLKTYFEANASPQTENKVREGLEKIKEIWLPDFHNALKKISSDIPLPKNIYMTVDNNFGEFFKKIINEGNYSNISFAENPFNTILLNEKLLEKYCAYNRMTANLDPFLAIEALYYNKILY